MRPNILYFSILSALAVHASSRAGSWFTPNTETDSALLNDYSSQPDAPDIQTSSGLLKGYSPLPGVHAYIGIRYAQPPIGSLRFEPPKRYKPANVRNAYDATRPFPSCYQVRYNSLIEDKFSFWSESEDCLYVTVWKPANHNVNKDKPLPVLIWIYGGDFTEGGTNAYDGTDFIREQQDVIFVDFNYRLNIFGFPNSPAVTPNLGLLDQRLAVEWIRDNIAAFGGDPKKMSLMGQSAGSMSIAYWSYAYPDDPIVRGFIELSGQEIGVQPDDGTSWKNVGNVTGCDKKGDAKAQVECLRKLPARELRRAITPTNLAEYGDATGGGPAVDNKTYFSAAEYTKRGLAGRFAKVPTLLSQTTHEGDNLVSFDTYKNPGIDYTESDIVTKYVFQCTTAAAGGYKVKAGVPTYRVLYAGNFAELQPYSWMRPYHGVDILLFFSQAQYGAWQELGPGILAAGPYYRSAIVAFVKDPVNGLKDLGWPRYNPEAPTIVELFAKNNSAWDLVDPRKYDVVCEQAAGTAT